MDAIANPAITDPETDKEQMPSRLQRAPAIVGSALFIILYFTAVFLTGLATLYTLSNDPEQVEAAYPILWINLPIIGLFGLYLLARIWRALFSKNRTLTAPLLHRRFVLIFSLSALMPAILVGGFSTSLIRHNINDLFGENMRRNINQARTVLDDYVSEQIQALIIPNISPMALVLNETVDLLPNRVSYSLNVQKMARTRGLDAAYVIRGDGLVLASAESEWAPPFQLPAREAFEELDVPGKIGLQSRDDEDFLIALTKLEAYEDSYLYIGRRLRSQSPVLSSIAGMAKAGTAFETFDKNQSRINNVFLLTFVETALLILFTATWLGFLLANRIIEPLGRLVSVAERVREGDLTARVTVDKAWGEMSDLGSAFNRMTRQLDTQRDDLIRERDLSEHRRQFSEAVLSGVRAGVIGLSQEGKISLLNQSAEHLLGMNASHLLSYPIDSVLPEFAPAFRAARESIKGTAEDQITFEAASGLRNFDLRVSVYEGDRKDTGWVVTFDDMTRLVAAQRHSAWREVARRIAHEIKNPLTPIQLSAERLRRKYKNAELADPDIFENCTQTIIRQVSSLEKMVDEFSTFARMPAPVFGKVNMQDMLEGILFEQGVAYPDITFDFKKNAQSETWVYCDERLVTQALTNIFKNAAESINRHIDTGRLDIGAGRIQTILDCLDDSVILSFIDNGVGWPTADKERLLEPYVTTREGGTGLGLAIVNRIAEDHGGDLILCERADGQIGARLQFYLPGFGLHAPQMQDESSELSQTRTHKKQKEIG